MLPALNPGWGWMRRYQRPALWKRVILSLPKGTELISAEDLNCNTQYLPGDL